MNIVEIRDFCFAYPDCSSKVLDQVNLSIQEGTLNVICGRSGCGKSTLLRHLKSVLMPHGTASGETAAEIRLHVAVRTDDRENAVMVSNEGDSIYTNGPTGGGGATMRISEIISVFSFFIPRDAVRAQVECEVL